MVRFIEVSRRITAGMKTYPGLPEPKVDAIIDYESSRERYGGKAEFLRRVPTSPSCHSSASPAHSVEVLVRAGPAFVGIDSLNIDDTADLSRPARGPDKSTLPTTSRWDARRS